MPAITRAQRLAIQKIYYRGPIYKNGKSSAQIAEANGWRYVQVVDLPQALRDKICPTIHTYVWIHDTKLPVYAESNDLVKDYQMAEEVRYREFRRTVKHGFDCLMVQWAGMWLGIEKDGYIHS